MGSSPPRPWHGCHLLAIILLVFQLLPSTSAAPCDANNVGKTYTTCVANKRTALYYWLVPCEESGYSLPPNKYNLPCDKLCSSGYYLPFGETECAPCQPGEYSLGTGEIINEWDTLPPSMSVDCDGLACQDWVPSGHYIHSGSNQNAHNSSVNLRLVANFVLQTGNKIQFRYMVDSQDCSLDCDGLVFYIDGVAKTPMISRQRTWATLEFDLNTGFHDFTWAFVKDYSGTFGEDRAAIKWIHLIGTTFSHETCSQCTAGTYSDAIAAPECTLCDYNHFNPERGATKCEPCSPGYYAFQGALNCTLLPKCESRHIFSSRTTCKVPELTQDIVYQYLTLDDGHVRTCNENLPGSTPLPASIRNVPCYCPPGEWLKSNGQCEYCPEGQARMNETSCHTCPIGTAASKAMYFADWSHIPSRFTVRCIGPCDTMGWIARGDHVDAGYGGANDEQALLELENVELITSGVLEFHYTLSGRCFVFCTSRIIITDVAQNEVIASDILKTGTSKVYQRELPPGKYTLTWRFTMNFGLFETLTLMKIHSISLSGVAVGGAPACVSCPLGTEGLRAGISSCKPCDIGHYSDTPGQLCKLADAGFFVDAPGASAQIPCGAGTTSNAARTDCDTDCTFTYPASGDKRGYKYDLRSLYNPEVMNFAGTDLYSHQYFLNLCSRVHKNSTCFNADGEPIPTFGCQQVNGWNYATDLGHVIGFEAGEDPSQGLMISLTQGTPGCASRYGSKVPRSTTVSMVCDVSAGIGSPKPAYPDNTVEYPAGSCTYHFVWRSAYACPVCTPDDYEVSLSDCLNGIKVKSYVRKIDCWDPQPLPSEEIPCQSCPMDKNGLICSNHGTCNEFTGVCDCEVSWSGSVCASCSVGHFGADCAQVCPGGRALPCDGHGVCDSGLLGTGECTCSTGWAGNACSTCAEGFEGDKCTAKPASVGDVVPWWGFLILFGGVGIIVVIAIVLWRQKKQVEYKYTSLLRNQPLEMEGNENNIEIEDDDDEEDVADRNW